MQVCVRLPPAGLGAAKLQCIHMMHRPACLDTLPSCQALTGVGRRQALDADATVQPLTSCGACPAVVSMCLLFCVQEQPQRI